uniref:Transcriptional regulator n=1 Tax=Thermosporothrix sp. COM3 TaxID=2490863 RepID=A0A455SK13_9CHLR|nr:transcriptional regulator [Thermosporothrix sp. COM3]
MRERVKRKAGLAEFLQSRRARLHPEQFHLPTYQRRRARGLRREEVAQLVGVGVSWYTWLEQGRDIQVSTQVLERLASILQLDDEERRHLFSLAQDSMPPMGEVVSPDETTQRILDGFRYPARLFDRRGNVVGWNECTRRVFGDYPSFSERERNALWYHFVHPAARTLSADWEREARSCLAAFHVYYDRYPDDPWYNELIEELREKSPEFRAWWPEHEIALACGKFCALNHPEVGYLVLCPTTFPVPNLPGIQMVVYTPLDDAETKLQQLMIGR